MRAWGLIVAAVFAACASSKGAGLPDGSGGSRGSGGSGGSRGSGGATGSGGGHDASGDSTLHLGDGAPSEGGGCTPPDMLIVLDHTDSMSDEPNGKKPANTAAGHLLSKWYLATQAVKAVVAPPLDEKIAFGLELFPLDPHVVTDAGGTGKCQTLMKLLGGTASTNTSCEAGEILVAPAGGTGATITSLLDPEAVALCNTTPIKRALETAGSELASSAKSGVAQYVLLVTDGGETCASSAAVVTTAQGLAAAGVKTFVVGFGATEAGSAGVNVHLLDDLACAGMTAPGFPAPCVKGAAGYTAKSTSGAPIFSLAEDGTSLETALATITGSVCCGCVK